MERGQWEGSGEWKGGTERWSGVGWVWGKINKVVKAEGREGVGERNIN